MLEDAHKALERKFENFSRWMDLNPQELEELAGIIGKYLQEKNRLAFQKQNQE